MTSVSDNTSPFRCHRDAAMALLTSGSKLNRKQGQFLGGIAFDDTPLSDKQHNWLGVLLERASLPPLAGGDA